jgi:hypothetical protein
MAIKLVGIKEDQNGHRGYDRLAVENNKPQSIRQFI